MGTHKHIAQKLATLDDIAARAGVSRMAASVVLNHSKSGTRVSPQKRQQILDIAKDLNYRPNLVARALAQKSTHIFGFYSGFNYFDARNPFVSEIMAGLLDECGRRSRDLLLHALFRGQDVHQLHDELVSGKIDGLVVWAPAEDPLVALLRESHLPVVSIVEQISPFPSVGVDDFAGAVAVGQYLFDCGHRHILYLTQCRPTPSRQHRREGIEQVARQLGMAVSVVAEPTPDGLISALRSPNTAGLMPTAIACWNDIVAYQAISQCQRAGYKVPANIAITGFDGVQLPIEIDLGLTSVRAPWAQVASTAIKYLVDLLEGKEVPTETLLPVEMIRGTTA